MKYLKVIVRFGITITLLLLLWQGAVSAFNLPPYLLPSPIKVLQTLYLEWRVFLDAAIPTFKNAIIGGMIGMLGGFILGAACSYTKPIKWLLEPYLTIFQSFPREAFFPLMIVWLGFGDLPKVINAILLSIFPMAIITLDALLDTRNDYIKLMSSWSASRWQVFRFCRLPAATPAIIGGVRVTTPLALIGSVLGEFLGSSSGLGYIIVSAGSAFRVDRAFAAILILAFGGTLMVFTIDFVKNKFFSKYFQR